MRAVRVYLGFNVVVWLPYAIYCAFNPAFLEGAAGLAAQSSTATTELRAMYGGLQAGIGALALAALLRPAFVRAAVTMLAFLCSGLASVRLMGLLVDSSASGYTIGALIFEVFNALLGLYLMSVLADHESKAATAG